MSWQDQLMGDSLSWLLETTSPGVYYLALRDVFEHSDDDIELYKARETAHKNGPIAIVLDAMDEKGYWIEPGPGYNSKYYSTIWSVILLAQLGAVAEEDKRISHACEYLLDHTLAGNRYFSRTGTPSGTIDCLQGYLCWALLELGCDDARLDSAFEWMARSVTGEGVAPLEDRQAPLRYYASQCGPRFACGYNYQMSCAWGAVKTLLAFGKLAKEKRNPVITQAIQQGIDFIFSTDPAKADYPGGVNDKPSQNWWKFGFPVFYITDVLQLVEAMVSLGYGCDPRLSNAISIILDKQDINGRWSLEYNYNGKTWVDFGEKKQPNKWVTLRALRILKAIGTT